MRSGVVVIARECNRRGSIGRGGGVSPTVPAGLRKMPQCSFQCSWDQVGGVCSITGVSELPLGLQGVTGVAVAMLPTSLAFLSQEIRVMRGYDCTVLS